MEKHAELTESFHAMWRSCGIGFRLLLQPPRTANNYAVAKSNAIRLKFKMPAVKGMESYDVEPAAPIWL